MTTNDDVPIERLMTGPRRWGPLFAGIWLFYLIQPLQDGWERHDSCRGWVGMAAIVAFAALYMVIFWLRRNDEPGPPLQWRVLRPILLLPVAVEVVLAVLICSMVGEHGLSTAPYIAVALVVCLPLRFGWMGGVGTGAIAYAATLSVPGWTRDNGILFGTAVATLAVFGIAQAMSRAGEVARMRVENANLAVEEERNRFARDLHDILGHSLTVVTVKAELAQRLLEVDLERARAELADLERLSRDALADVRLAVRGYREITLPNELARAKAALLAAEIEPVLPGSTDAVPTELRDLFAWTVREGVTNVIRHSRATRCEIVFGESNVEVRDNGRGPVGPDGEGQGSGLTGLRERAQAVGASVTTRALSPGFLLEVHA